MPVRLDFFIWACFQGLQINFQQHLFTCRKYLRHTQDNRLTGCLNKLESADTGKFLKDVAEMKSRPSNS